MFNPKKALAIVSGISAVGVLLGYVVWEYGLNYCTTESCKVLLAENIGKILFVGLPFVVIAAIFLMFFSEKTQLLWERFIYIYLPISIIVILITPVDCNAPLNLCFTKVLTTLLLGVIFLLLSLAIIIYQKIKERRK